MLLKSFTKLCQYDFYGKFIRNCHSIFGLKDLIYQEKISNVSILPVHSEEHDLAIDMIRQHYLTEHILVRERNMNLAEDRALDEYLANLLKQGNSLYVKTSDGTMAALCVSFASSPVDPKNLRNFAFYRQDPNTKDFLYFTAKLQETPNLWTLFKVTKVFEIKMLMVLPEYRRHGLATMLVEKSQWQAHDQGYNIVRMDCINHYDYKVAERCMFQCLTRFPLHKLRGANAPFIKRSSENNRCVRVYVKSNVQVDTSDIEFKKQLCDSEDSLG